MNFAAVPLRFSAIEGPGAALGYDLTASTAKRPFLPSRGVTARAALRQVLRLGLASDLPHHGTPIQLE